MPSDMQYWTRNTKLNHLRNTQIIKGYELELEIKHFGIKNMENRFHWVLIVCVLHRPNSYSNIKLKSNSKGHESLQGLQCQSLTCCKTYNANKLQSLWAAKPKCCKDCKLQSLQNLQATEPTSCNAYKTYKQQSLQVAKSATKATSYKIYMLQIPCKPL